jgi:predicted MFS family arabinose efflux permease
MELRNSLESSLRYEAYQDNYEGLKRFFHSASVQQTIQKHKNILQKALHFSYPNIVQPVDSIIVVADGANQIYYSSSPNMVDKRFTIDAMPKVKGAKVLSGEIQFVRTRHYYQLFTPLNSLTGSSDVFISIGIDPRFVEHIPSDRKIRTIQILVTLTVTSVLLLIGFNVWAVKMRKSLNKIIRRRVRVAVFTIVCITQLLFFLFGLSQFVIDIWQSNQSKNNVTFFLLADRLEGHLSVTDDKFAFKHSENFVNQFSEAYPEISSLSFLPFYLNDNSNSIKMRVSPPINQNSKPTVPNQVGSIPMRADFVHMVHNCNGRYYGMLIGQQNTHLLIKKIINIAMDLLTVLVITILLLVELLILLFKMMGTTRPKSTVAPTIHYSFMRPAAFLFLFGIDISMSFLPLHADNLYEPFWGLSKDTVMGLPISVEFLFVGISIFISGFWNDRRGWHEPFLTGLFLSATGGIYSWLAPNILHFIVSRALVGIGYGFMLLAAQGFVIAHTDASNRAQGLAQFIAGLYAGSICGGATGALLADYFGYRSVFLFGAILLYGVMIYTFIFFRQAMVKPMQQETNTEAHKAMTPKWKPFFKNKVVIALVFFSSLPATIAVVGFLNYFSPIYLNAIGASQATIGRVLMIYGVSLIFIGPIISKHVDASCDKKRYIFIGCVLGSFTFLIFHFFNGLYAAIIAVFLLGLSSSFIIASQGAYLLNLHVTQGLGAGKAIGFFRATSRVGQALGPLVFSVLTISMNVGKDIAQMGLFYLLTAFLFLLITYRDKFEFQRNQK